MSENAAPATAAPHEKKPKAPKSTGAKKVKSPAKHPKFSDMSVEAIVSLKERSGSSLPAIKKWIEQKYGKDLPRGWEKMLSLSLKRMATSQQLTKVKASFKLGEALKKASTKKPAAKKQEGEKKTATKPVAAAGKASKPSAASKKSSKPATAAKKVQKPAASNKKASKPVAAAAKAAEPGSKPAKVNQRVSTGGRAPKKASALKKPTGVQKPKASPKPGKAAAPSKKSTSKKKPAVAAAKKPTGKKAGGK